MNTLPFTVEVVGAFVCEVSSDAEPCGRAYSRRPSLQHHLEVDHHLTPEAARNVAALAGRTTLPPGGSVRYPACRHPFASVERLARHSRIAHPALAGGPAVHVERHA